jgi:hypothetical protein
MQDRITILSEQLQLATQWLVRLQLTVDILSQGKGVRVQEKPGKEGEVQMLPVPDDAPLVRLVATPMKVSKILTGVG